MELKKNRFRDDKKVYEAENKAVSEKTNIWISRQSNYAL